MALETLKEAITAYTGLSPTTFFTVIALLWAIYYVLTSLFGPSDHQQRAARAFQAEQQMEPLPPPVQVGEITEQELKQYDGTDPKKPLLMAIKGQIYDITQSRMFYGPGGPYHLFAGKDASRALAKMSFEDKDLTGDISGLGPFELDALQDWEYKFMGKYVKVGTVKKTVPVAEGTSSGESAVANNSEASKPVEETNAKPAEETPSGTAAAETDGTTTVKTEEATPSGSAAADTEGTRTLKTEDETTPSGNATVKTEETTPSVGAAVKTE